MTWDEGPVSALRARITELEWEVAKQSDIAATASEQAAIWGAQRDRAVAALDKIAAVMRERMPDDVALSEIQDWLTIAGYDVPLRSYRETK